MAAEDLGKSFVQEFVIGFGFLSGLWIHVGINPETEIIKAFSSITPSLAFWIIPVITTLGSLVGSYFLGGWLGLIAVGLAFIGGIFFSSNLGVICLILGVLIGFAAPFTVQ